MSAAKKFLTAKDCRAKIDFEYVEKLRTRLREIFTKMDLIVYPSIRKNEKLPEFLYEKVDTVWAKVQENGIINKLTNQGRRSEDILFNWGRGYACAAYFEQTLADLSKRAFGDKTLIIKCGEDNFNDIKTFRRKPAADFEIVTEGNVSCRIEFQSGFQGKADLKKHKITCLVPD